MPCERVSIPINNPDGTVKYAHTIVCSRGRRQKKMQRCVVCGTADPCVAMRLCDGRTDGRRKKTCDAPICVHCAVHVEPDKDFCPRCIRMLKQQILDLLRDNGWRGGTKLEAQRVARELTGLEPEPQNYVAIIEALRRTAARF
jgi:hypothetical protein